MEHQQNFIEEAEARGRFQGEVLTSLKDIKLTLEEMKMKHALQDTKIEQKAERNDVEDLKKRVWFFSGAASVAGALLGKLFG